MLYTKSMTVGTHEPYEQNPVDIDIGSVDGDVARWWKAIISRPDGGWRAIISHHEGKSYLSPWSISRKDQNTLRIRWRASGSKMTDDSNMPLSSKRAFDALC